MTEEQLKVYNCPNCGIVRDVVTTTSNEIDLITEIEEEVTSVICMNCRRDIPEYETRKQVTNE